MESALIAILFLYFLFSSKQYSTSQVMQHPSDCSTFAASMSPWSSVRTTAPAWREHRQIMEETSLINDGKIAWIFGCSRMTCVYKFTSVCNLWVAKLMFAMTIVCNPLVESRWQWYSRTINGAKNYHSPSVAQYVLVSGLIHQLRCSRGLLFLKKSDNFQRSGRYTLAQRSPKKKNSPKIILSLIV
jgi:hypothetical protein